MVLERVGLPITVGVARTKFLAKVASRVAKPDGVLLVEPEDELEFLHPLPVDRLWGVGPVSAAKLEARGVTSVGQVARLTEPTLIGLVGPAAGRKLHALAHNRDPRPVTGGRRRRSIGSQHALGRGHHSHAELDAILLGLVDRIARRLRSGERVGRTIMLRLRLDDSSRATRSHTFLEATDRTDVLVAGARSLLAQAQPLIRERGITLVGVTIANLTDGHAMQLELDFARLKAAGLDAALDDVRDRFGSQAVTRAVLVGRSMRAPVPLLPD
jgi:DNA polymerase-4